MNTRLLKKELSKKYGKNLSVYKDGGWVKIVMSGFDYRQVQRDALEICKKYNIELNTYMSDDYADRNQYPCLTVYN